MAGIPPMTAEGRGMARAWERSLDMVLRHGAELRTEYDAKNDAGEYVDPPSRDATMMIVVHEPDSEPAIHRCFPGGLEDLEEYRREVLDGIKDHWIADESDPADKRWHYTYHDRFAAYFGYNQLEEMAQKLAKAPHSRRCQAVTCDPRIDRWLGDPPCLQSFWARVFIDEDGVWWVCVDVRFRSRDAYNAAFMNMWALCGRQGMQGQLVKRIAALTGMKAFEDIRCGRYVDTSDSFHVYGSNLVECRERFQRALDTRVFEDRTWERADAEAMFIASRPVTDAKIKAHAEQNA